MEYLNRNKVFFNNDSKVALFKLGYLTKKVMNTMERDELSNFSKDILKGMDYRYFKPKLITRKIYPFLTSKIVEHNLPYSKLLENVSSLIISTNGFSEINEREEDYVLYFFLGFNMVKDIDVLEVMTINEAAEKWKKDASTLRRVIQNDKFVEGFDYRRSGKTILITRESMIRVYGEPKNE